MGARVGARGLRFLLGALFLVAGAMKVWDFPAGRWATPQFFEDVLNYHLLPWYPAMAVAVYLPWLEMVVGLGLMTRRWGQGALLWSAVLVLIFLGALGSAWARGLDVDCGCFGRAMGQEALWVPIARDGALLGALALIAWLERRPAAREPGELSRPA